MTLNVYIYKLYKLYNDLWGNRTKQNLKQVHLKKKKKNETGLNGIITRLILFKH